MAIVQVTKNTYTVDTLYQWDKGQTLAVYGLSLPSIPEVRFCHKGADRSIVRQATMDAAGVVRAEIPDSLLQQAYTIWVYIGLYDGEAFRTHYKIEISVKAQAKPLDYTIEDSPEVYSFDQLENQMANLEASVAAKTAQMSQQLTSTENKAAAAVTAANNAAKSAEDAVKQLAEAEEALASAVMLTLTHTKTGTVHELTGLGDLAGLVNAQFKATAAITKGDTLTIDGVSYTAQMTNGEALATDFWAVGATVGCILDTEDKVVNFKGGGASLPKLTNPAGAAQIIQGYQAINGEGVLMEGTAGQDMTNPAGAAQILNGYEAILADGSVAAGTYVPYYKQYLYQNCTSSSKDTTCTFTATGGTIDLAVCWLTDGYTITDVMQYVGLYYNGNIIKAQCGSFTLSKITSVSGNVVTAVCDSTDVSNAGDSLRMHCVIFSH